MKMKSIPHVAWIIPLIVLLIATAQLPYGYYTFTRIMTCGAAAFIAIVGFQESPAIQAWSVLLLAIAVLFNPFVPIHLTRGLIHPDSSMQKCSPSAGRTQSYWSLAVRTSRGLP
jgi:Family of unknown function (DUF6804)